MIKVFLKSRNGDFEATAFFNESTKETVVQKGSKISPSIAGGAFRSAKSVEKRRNSKSVEGCDIIEDISFTSASSAANFVTGRSTNGMVAWKTAEGISLKEYLERT